MKKRGKVIFVAYILVLVGGILEGSLIPNLTITTRFSLAFQEKEKKKKRLDDLCLRFLYLFFVGQWPTFLN